VRLPPAGGGGGRRVHSQILGAPPVVTRPWFGRAGRWLRRRAENVLAALLAVMFVAFIVQIVFRYLLNFPIGWSSELTVITWLWGVLWGAAFVVKESEEIRFDIIYGAVSLRARRAMGVITGLAIVLLYVLSLEPTLDYVRFMKVEKTAYLKIRFDHLYSVYLLFVVAVVVRYAWILWRLLRGEEPAAPDSDTVSPGL
jgi:TRAP-type C4-dicarboxylate transport system permease small subunit